jgi:DUF4097 and DUF4098 domain-containing protein YvlB
MKFTVSLLICTALFATAVSADVTEETEVRYQLNQGGRISLGNVNGNVTIKATAGNEVVIKTIKKAGSQEYLDDLQVKINATDSRITIDTKHPESEGGWFNWSNSSGSVTFELTVPYDVELDTIETVNGDIEIVGVKGAVSAETVNGNMLLEGLQSDADLDTVNGKINAQFDLLDSGQRVHADTVNGRIVLRIPSESSAQVYAETLNGGIDADDFDLEAEKGFVGRDLDGRIGDGGARLSLDTVNGSITIERND